MSQGVATVSRSLARDAIFVCVAGSLAHGTEGPESDVDLRGVAAIPPAQRLTLWRLPEQQEIDLDLDLDVEDRRSLLARFKPQVWRSPRLESARQHKVEGSLFEVARFLHLLQQANPAALELLFADENDWLLDTPAWRVLWDRRRDFLTERVLQTLLGYAAAQLRKIKSHRGWLLAPPTAPPERADFGLPAVSPGDRASLATVEGAVDAQLRCYGLADVAMPRDIRQLLAAPLVALQLDVLSTLQSANDVDDVGAFTNGAGGAGGAGDAGSVDVQLREIATTALDLPEALATRLRAERAFRRALEAWRSYCSWKEGRNPRRAALEASHGYDTKHAMHLIRLMRMGREVARDGDFCVRRPDADELRAIKEGAWTWETVSAEAARIEAEVKALGGGRLPSSPLSDEALDGLFLEVMEKV